MVKKILFIDDEEDQVNVIQKIFENLYSKEYKIIPAYSGKECFIILKKLIPDIIILDLMMPEMTGWEVFDKLKKKEHWKNIPIIILTARTDGFAEYAGNDIADDFIIKPINAEELKIRIDYILNK